MKMIFTAPGCGMGPVLQQDAQNRLLCIDGVDEVDVETWDPLWNRDMMTEEAQLQLGMMMSKGTETTQAAIDGPSSTISPSSSRPLTVIPRISRQRR